MTGPLKLRPTMFAETFASIKSQNVTFYMRNFSVLTRNLYVQLRNSNSP